MRHRATAVAFPRLASFLPQPQPHRQSRPSHHPSTRNVAPVVLSTASCPLCSLSHCTVHFDRDTAYRTSRLAQRASTSGCDCASGCGCGGQFSGRIMLPTWLATVLLGVVAGTRSPAQAEVHVGTAINVFSRYGYLSISMRVVPRNDSDRSWIVREPTVEIFSNVSNANTDGKRSTNKGETFLGDFHMEFCDNILQLLQGYFRDFSVERLEKPWKAFTASWSRNIIARNLGIGSSYVNGLQDHCYVLIRVARHREVATMPAIDEIHPEAVSVEDIVQKKIEDIKVGDSSSVIEFMRNFGSHYITSFVTGNSLYQVFVYEPERYRHIRERLRQKGIEKIPRTELMEYFSPLHARHIGRILSASGNETVELWASRKLQLSFFPIPFVSLLKLHTNSNLLNELDSLLGNEALLRLNLKTLAPAFKDTRKRDWFHHVLDNHLKLWEVNM